MNDVLLAAGWIWSSDGRSEEYYAPYGWAETSDAEVREVRALEAAGWSAGELPDGRMLVQRGVIAA